ncbi:hypothetical protein [Psychromonas sp. Urea-02u-13]|uniref:hypothetical protein n=1 Tax=Psychromonas sp. Urea-02u-13 TaxID=2058326 RepID=UPI000C3212F1|nr:hypothetical protein [Psychromonas sp. Urea-02u-13]PKG39896.1 hypothetical protein CXF74_06080 [Psychromonas sp. Urea-02u-13]
MNTTQAQLERLFELEKELNILLDEERYEEFLPQQDQFSAQIKYLLDNSPEEEMLRVISQLQRLENAVELLQQRSNVYFLQLKEKSLLQRRNKSKIKAYK